MALASAVYVLTAVMFWHRTLLPDEIRPLLLTQRPLSEQIAFIQADIVQTPAFNMLSRLWLGVTGPTDTAAKSLVVVVNVLAIVAFAMLARRVTTGWLVAILVATLFYLRVGSSITIVRMYGLAVLFVILAMLNWDTWIRTGSARAGLGWSLCMAAGIYTHATAGMILPAFVIASWADRRRRMAGLTLATLPVILVIPWVVSVLPEFMERGITANVRALSADPWRRVARIPFEFLSGEDPGGMSPPLTFNVWAARYPLRWAAFGMHMLLAAAFVLHLHRIRREAASGPWIAFAVSALLIPALVLLALALSGTPAVSTRYMLIALPAYWLLLSWTYRAGGRLGRAMVGLIVIWLVMSAAGTWIAHSRPSRVRLAVEAIAGDWQQGDMVLNADHYPTGYQSYWEWVWRLQEPGPIVNLHPPEWALPWLRDILPHQDLRTALESAPGRIWLFSVFRERTALMRDSLAVYGYAERGPVGSPGLLWCYERTRGESGEPPTASPSGAFGRHQQR